MYALQIYAGYQEDPKWRTYKEYSNYALAICGLLYHYPSYWLRRWLHNLPAAKVRIIKVN